MIYTSLAMNRNLNQTQLFQQTTINGALGIVGYKKRTENQKMVKKGIVELVDIGIITIYSDLKWSKEVRTIDLKGNMMFLVQFNDEYVYSEEFVSRFNEVELGIE